MARLTGPLMSLSASGTIADTLTYADWKGISYARTRVIPSNPQTSDQQEVRTVFRYLQSLYKFMPAIGREPWIAAVIGVPMTPQNLMIKRNVAALQSETDLNLITLSPGARGGVPPVSITPTPDDTEISVAVSVPSPPTGWTLTAAQGIAVKDQDPHDPIEASPVAAEDTTSTYAVVLTGLESGTVYQVAVWLKWLTPSGLAAYSVALLDQSTTTTP